MTKKYYMAYGSNLNLADMKKRCKDSELFGSGYLEGYKLSFNGKDKRTYLTIKEFRDSKVPVGVFRTSEADERALDTYESYPDLYYKKDIDLTIDAGEGPKKIRAYTYIMDERYGINTPSEDYFATCLKGYEDFDFDKTYLYEARALAENS